MPTWVASQWVRDSAVPSTGSARPEVSSRRGRSAAITAKIVQTMARIVMIIDSHDSVTVAPPICSIICCITLLSA
jgi:hypothetical protein